MPRLLSPEDVRGMRAPGPRPDDWQTEVFVPVFLPVEVRSG